ncbi:hypothetical protein [Massilia eburnea]|uniref:hypothetical protein n=1 Tax=Massilia eburnea TaxID=1776165 RepID=UPI003D6C6659
MAMDWAPVLNSFVAPFANVLGVPSNNVRTKKVSAERMATSKILEELLFDKKSPAVVGPDGFCVILTTKAGEKFLVLHRPASTGAFDASFEKYSDEFRFDVVKDIDPFIFFVANRLRLRIDPSFTAASLTQRLGATQVGESFELDFDVACSVFGAFKVWKISRDVPISDLTLLLSFAGSHFSINFVENYDDFGFSNIKEIKVFDVNGFLKSVFNPIFKLVDQIPKAGVIKFSDAAKLGSSVEFAIKEPEDVVLGPQSRAYFDFRFDGRNYLFLPLSNLTESQIYDVIGNIESAGGIQQELSISHVLAFSYSLQGSFLPSQRFVGNPNSIVDMLDIGSNISVDSDQLLALYDEYYVFDISNAANLSKWDILCDFSIKYDPFRSSFVTEPIIASAGRLVDIGNVPAENIYTSLSASHWKHSFLEVYRIIEGLYYFPWMMKLKASLNSQVSEFTLFDQCKKNASWSYTEQASIMSLFELIPLEIFSSCSPVNIACLTGRFDGKNPAETLRSFAAALYAVRNTNVHQGLHNPADEIYPTNRCWEHLTHALYLAAEYFYKTHPNGMPPR